MNHWKANIGIWGAAGLLGVAILLSQYEDRRKAEAASSAADALQAIALDWAHQKLWSDFLETRPGGANADRHVAPGMDEYRAYLTSIGLSEFGDDVTFYIVGTESAASADDRMRVARYWRDEALTFDVTVEHQGRSLPAGTLRIRTDREESIYCDVEHEPSPALWSFWPITAQPLLP